MHAPLFVFANLQFGATMVSSGHRSKALAVTRSQSLATGRSGLSDPHVEHVVQTEGRDHGDRVIGRQPDTHGEGRSYKPLQRFGGVIDGRIGFAELGFEPL